MPTNCPKCNAVLYCPCHACREYEPKGLDPVKDHYHWQPNGEIVECPVCGYADHCDQWLTAEMERWKKKETQGVIKHG